MAVRDVFFLGGQSNSLGVNASGETGPDLATVPFWKDEVGITASPSLGALFGAAFVNPSTPSSSGCTYTFGRLLLTYGVRPIIWNIARGSTAANMWIPGGTYYNQMVTSLTNALAATVAAYPGDTFRFHHIRDQGEYEARYGYPSPNPGEQAIIDAWATNVQATHTAFETVIGRKAYLHVIGTNYQLDGQNNPASFRALQRSAVTTAVNPGIFQTRDSADGISYDDVAGLHPNQAGYILHGSRLAASIASFIASLGSVGATTRSAWVDHIRNKATAPVAANHYVHLYQGADWTTPPTAGNAVDHAPASNTNDATTWPAAADRSKSNGVAFDFPEPGATWPAFRSWKLTNNATEGTGTVLAQGTHDAITATAATGAWSLPVGGITFTAADESLSDDVVHGLLDRTFGGAAFAQDATSHGGYWAGDPQGSGSQVGSRVAITQATAFASAAGGQSVSVASVALTQQVTGTYWAEHDAGAGGNLILSAPRPAAVGLTGNILPGQIQTVIT